MREPIGIFPQRCKKGKLPVDLPKVYLRIMLEALDHLHTQCQIIHTSKLATASYVDLGIDCFCRLERG